MSNDSVDQWLAYAANDLADAAHEVNTPGNRCSHAQQAAEKSLTATLQLEFGQVERTHDLDRLRDMLPAGWNVKNTHSDLSEITKWYVEGRYPNGETATINDASRMLLVAREIYHSITADIKLRGG